MTRNAGSRTPNKRMAFSFANFEARSDAIEECYEFMLAYAAQGLSGNEGSASGGQLRHFLIRAADALDGLAEACSHLEPPVKAAPYLKVVAADAAASHATLELVLAQPWISSQLIDNLNASMHLRALLTNLFLIGEIEKIQASKMAFGMDGPNSFVQSIPPDNN